VTRPPPLIGAHVDLRGLQYLPVDIQRLLDSDLYALSSGEEFKAALTLWARSFLQVPAGSLPDDDRLLAHLSGVGARRWPKVRGMALHGFIRCADGRLYHPVVCEKAEEAWKLRMKLRSQTENARLARRNNANESGGSPPQATDNERSRVSVTDIVTDSVTTSVTASNRRGEEIRGKNHPHSPPQGGRVVDHPHRRRVRAVNGMVEALDNIIAEMDKNDGK